MSEQFARRYVPEHDETAPDDSPRPGDRYEFVEYAANGGPVRKDDIRIVLLLRVKCQDARDTVFEAEEHYPSGMIYETTFSAAFMRLQPSCYKLVSRGLPNWRPSLCQDAPPEKPFVRACWQGGHEP